MSDSWDSGRGNDELYAPGHMRALLGDCWGCCLFPNDCADCPEGNETVWRMARYQATYDATGNMQSALAAAEEATPDAR